MDRIYLAPSIPHEKLYAAIGSYGQGLRAEDVVVLIDDTVFGGAKDGVLVTEEEIRIKQAFLDHETYMHSFIRQAESIGNDIRFNGSHVVKLSMPDEHDLADFIGALSEFFRFRDQSTAAGPRAAARGESRDGTYEWDWFEYPGFFPHLDELIEEKFERSDDTFSIERFGHLLFLLNSTRQLLRFYEEFGFELTQDEVGIVGSDEVRLELLLLAFAVFMQVLSRRNMADAQELYNHFFIYILAPYFFAKEGGGDPFEFFGTLNKSTGTRYLRGSGFREAVMGRISEADDAISEGRVKEYLLESLCNSAELTYFSSEESEAIQKDICLFVEGNFSGIAEGFHRVLLNGVIEYAASKP